MSRKFTQKELEEAPAVLFYAMAIDGTFLPQEQVRDMFLKLSEIMEVSGFGIGQLLIGHAEKVLPAFVGTTFLDAEKVNAMEKTEGMKRQVCQEGENDEN